MKKRNLLCLLVAGMMAFSACGNDTATTPGADEVVMTIDDREITKSEYMVYLYTTTKNFVSIGGEDIWTMDFEGQTADELVEERTIDTLQTIIAAEKYADENEIVLTEALATEAKTMAESYVANLPEEDLNKMGVNEEQLAAYMEGSLLYSMVYQALAAECEIDEAGSASYYAENKTQILKDSTQVDFASIIVQSEAEANEIIQKFNAGEKFDDLFTQYDIEKDAEDGLERSKTTFYESQFSTMFGLETAPAVGTVTAPIENEGYYFVLHTENIVVPDDVALQDIANQKYTAQQQAEYSDTRLDEMIAAQKLDVKEELLSGFEKFH